MKSSKSFSDTLCPISLISVPQILTLSLGLQPNMYTPAMLIIFMPFAKIFFPKICPIHCTFSFFEVVLPITFKVVARRIIIHFTKSMLEIIFELSFKNTSAFEDDFSFSFFFPFFPLSFIGCIIDFISAATMSEAIFNFTFINRAIRPWICASSCYPVICKFPLVYDSISPNKLAVAR